MMERVVVNYYRSSGDDGGGQPEITDDVMVVSFSFTPTYALSNGENRHGSGVVR